MGALSTQCPIRAAVQRVKQPASAPQVDDPTPDNPKNLQTRISEEVVVVRPAAAGPATADATAGGPAAAAAGSAAAAVDAAAVVDEELAAGVAGGLADPTAVVKASA